MKTLFNITTSEDDVERFASAEDFEKMYLAGIDTAITCSYYPYKIDNESILLNHLTVEIMI